VGLLSLELRGRVVSKGRGVGEALVSKKPLSFFGGVNPKTGLVIEEGHSLKGYSVKGKVLVLPRGKGSTVGSWVLYELSINGLAPSAIINLEADPIVAVGAIIAGIPLVDKLNVDPFEVIENGDMIEVMAEGRVGVVRVHKGG